MKDRSRSAENQQSARERVLATARNLFYREGVRAIGVDTIVARSGVAKTSLYRWFATKDDLIAAFLSEEDKEFWDYWDKVARAHVNAPEDELRAHVTWIARYIAGPRFRGCPFLNVAAEFPDASHPARVPCEANKSEMRRRLKALASNIPVRQPGKFADHALLLIEGAFANSQVLGKKGPASVLVDAFEMLLAAARR